MPSMAHEILVDLFKNRPSLAAEILAEVLGADLPRYTDARLASTDLTARIAAAVLPAILEIGDDRARLYYDLVFNSLNQAARRALEAMMKGYGYQSDFARKYVAQGRTEEAARALLTVLRARGFTVPDAVRERILAQRDTEHLERWLEKAVVAPSVAAVFDEPN